MKRLPVNLASNPIELRRRLRRVTVTAVASAAVVTAVHAALGWSLLAAPAPDVAPDAAAFAELRADGNEVLELATAADPRAALRTAVSVGVANALIEQRVFPWAGLFAMLEETLPDDVRLELIQPLAAVDGIRVTLTAASDSGNALLEFLAALEQRPELRAVYPGRQLVGADGDLRMSIEALARIDDTPAPSSPEAGQ